MRSLYTQTAAKGRLALWSVTNNVDDAVWRTGVQLHRLLSSACSGSGAETVTDPLTPGAAFSLTKRFTLSDTACWAALTGDSNPIHVDGGAAAAAGLAAPILPGMLLAALFPAIIGSRFPGAVYLSQTLKFAQYAPVDEAYTATLKVQQRSGRRVSFATECRRDGTGAVVLRGEALALIGGAEQLREARHQPGQQHAEQQHQEAGGEHQQQR